ncbi:MAG: amino acid ABC transporter substrate-binding protein [Burkholderiales bacterium]
MRSTPALRTRRSRVLSAAVASLTLALCGAAQAGTTVDAIQKRGTLQCGVSTGVAGFSAPDSQGVWQGLDADLCRAYAAALLGDAKKVQYVPLNSQQRFAALQSGQVDVLARNTTWTLTRDASLGFHFAAITYFDGQGFLVPKKLKVTSAKQLKNVQVCVQSGTTSEKNLADWFRAQNIKYKPVVFEGFEASFKAFFEGRCQAYTTDVSGLAGVRNKEAKNPDDFVILPELISKEPLGPLVRRGDDEWFAIVKWVTYALIEAEEYGLTQASVAQAKTDSKDPGVQRLLGTTEDSGKLLGLDREWAYRAIAAVGNYGEMFERNVGSHSPLKLPRGANRLWNQGGLLYAPPVR